MIMIYFALSSDPSLASLSGVATLGGPASAVLLPSMPSNSSTASILDNMD